MKAALARLKRSPEEMDPPIPVPLSRLTPTMAIAAEPHTTLETPLPERPTMMGTKITVSALRKDTREASVVSNPILCVE